MTKVDISSEAVERLAARLPENYKEAVTELRENDEIAASMALRAQAERIKGLEGEREKYVTPGDMTAIASAVRTETRKDALREAAEVCTAVIRNYDVMKPDGKTYEPFKVQKAAGGMVALARQDILALIEGDKP